MNRRLLELGWDEGWRDAFERSGSTGVPARVVRDGRLLEVHGQSGRLYAEVPIERHATFADALRPVCGDWVAVEIHPGTERATVRAALARRSGLVRRAAGGLHRCQAIVANMDAVWIVCGLDRDQGLRSLERYQALARQGQTECTVVLNKADLCAESAACEARAREAAPGLEVIRVSATKRTGLERLRPLAAEGKTIALVGPSGVGKSTLINALGAEDAQRTGDVRATDRRGRHTTSVRQLVRSSGGALLVDTPGLRELGLWSSDRGLANVFSDIVELARACRFRDCRHDREPGCAVRDALERGQLSPTRFVRFLELEEEAGRGRAERRKRRR